MNDNTRLLRQVHPFFIRNGRITSQVFKPIPKDHKKLSTYDGDQITPKEAWNHYTTHLSLTSLGVVAVTVAECADEKLAVTSDPSEFHEHVLVDLSNLSNKQIEDAAKRLRNKAVTRGWLYQKTQPINKTIIQQCPSFLTQERNYFPHTHSISQSNSEIRYNQ